MEKQQTEELYSISECVYLRLFPLGRKTLYNLVIAGERKRAGEEVDDYVFGTNVGTPDRSCWRLKEFELQEWLKRRQEMLGKKGLQRTLKPEGLL